jgi:hypothetical protein
MMASVFKDIDSLRQVRLQNTELNKRVNGMDAQVVQLKEL